MLILAGVSINAIVGDDGILSRTQYSTFLSEMTAVEEAVQMWKAGEAIGQMGEETKEIPVNGLCNMNDLKSTERLVGEVGYYRVWSMNEMIPATSILTNASDFNNSFEGELISYPAGVQDLYYIDNEAVGIDSKRGYVIDAATGMIYSMSGVTLKGVNCYSANMATAVMSGTSNAPIFAEAEVSGSGTGDKLAGNVQDEYLEDGTKNPDYNPYGFQIIAEASNSNLYKLYNNGQLYAKGKKGILLNSSKESLKNCDQFSWVSSKISSVIPGANENLCTITVGYGTVYAIDKDGYLWAWGDNAVNKMGLDEESQINFSSYVAQKLNVDGKKVKKVFGTNWSTFVITEDNLLYASGGNLHGALGTGDKKVQTNKFEKIDFPEDPNNIKEIGNQNCGNELKKGDDFSFILTNTKIYFCGRCSTRCSKLKLMGYTENPETITKWTEIDVSTMFPGLVCNEAHISGTQQWWEQPYWYFYQNNLCYKMYVDGSVSKVNDFSDGSKLEIWSWPNDGSLIRIEKNNDTKYYCSIGPSVVNSLGTVDASGKPSFAQATYDVTDTFKKLEVDGKRITSIWSNVTVNIVKMSNGELYGCGLAAKLGIGESSGQKEWTRLTELENLDKDLEFPGSQKTLIFKNENGEIIGTNQLNLILGEKVLEKSWVLIQENVKAFNASTDGYTFAYVGTDGYLYVRGTRSNHLGLNKINTNIETLTKVDGAGASEEVVEALKTGVKKYFIRTDAMYILTNNNKLLISCYNYRGQVNNWGTFYYGLGKEEHPELVLMSDNVLDFDACTSYRGIVKKTDGIYTWGMRQSEFLNIDSQTLVEITNKEIWNGAGNWKSIQSGLTDGFLIGENYIVSQKLNGSRINLDENIIKVCSGGAWLFLSDTGNLYGFGNSKFLGDGQGSLGTSVKDIKLINSGNKFVNIVCGSNFAIAYTGDGKVYATGTNELGILGRWKGAPRSAGRYRTAFEWVECPELEI